MTVHPSSASGLVGQSSAIRRAVDQIERAGTSTVWVYGEVGTDKPAVARALHAGGVRRDGPLQIVDCGAFPLRLASSVLFGHETGAFIGATSRHRGALERANGGLVFLRAIERLAPPDQARLMHVLDTGMVRPIGSSAPRQVDIQIVAASHLRLGSAAHYDNFRRDLFER
ncbi:MAG: sigma 54-interacting transcriptional regulator, partial [Acidobacteriota bacterium]